MVGTSCPTPRSRKVKSLVEGPKPQGQGFRVPGSGFQGFRVYRAFRV